MINVQQWTCLFVTGSPSKQQARMTHLLGLRLLTTSFERWMGSCWIKGAQSHVKVSYRSTNTKRPAPCLTRTSGNRSLRKTCTAISMMPSSMQPFITLEAVTLVGFPRSQPRIQAIVQPPTWGIKYETYRSSETSI
jgi:hypothetical protein